LYSLAYTNSTEEERYLTAIQNEQLSLQTLIREQDVSLSLNVSCLNAHFKVLYTPTEYDVSRDTTSQLRSLALRTDSRKNRQEQPELDDLQPMVIIDMREFNSELPTVIYKRGIDLLAATLEVGDYVLSPDICVERKALDDLAQSLTNGRIFKQVEQVSLDCFVKYSEISDASSLQEIRAPN
jgi:DNA excision repair protein ERCC-4